MDRDTTAFSELLIFLKSNLYDQVLFRRALSINVCVFVRRDTLHTLSIPTLITG